MTNLRTAAQQALEACPFCGNEPSFSGDASEWKDESRYVELSLGCCVSMTEQIGWRRARDMTHEAKTAELRSRLQLRWNTRAALAEPVQEPYAWMAVGGTIWRHKSSEDDLPLYTAPRVPLTEWQINDLMANIDPEDVDSWSFRQGVYATEKHHGVRP